MPAIYASFIYCQFFPNTFFHAWNNGPHRAGILHSFLTEIDHILLMDDHLHSLITGGRCSFFNCLMWPESHCIVSNLYDVCSNVVDDNSNIYTPPKGGVYICCRTYAEHMLTICRTTSRCILWITYYISYICRTFIDCTTYSKNVISYICRTITTWVINSDSRSPRMQDLTYT